MCLLLGRVYAGAESPKGHTIEGTGYGSLVLEKSNMSDTVVWNPWAENAAKMGDLGDEEVLLQLPQDTRARMCCSHTLLLLLLLGFGVGGCHCVPLVSLKPVAPLREEKVCRSGGATAR